MTEPDTGKETRLVDVKGRTIVVRLITDAQFALMAQLSRLLQRDGVDNKRKVAGAGRMFDILESMVVQEEDRDYVTDLIATGDLVLTDLTGFISAFKDEEAKPKVRRGRPPTKRV
jgi:hypothetical protein